MSEAGGNTVCLAVIAGVLLALSTSTLIASTLLKLRKHQAWAASDAVTFSSFALAVVQTSLILIAREKGLGSRLALLEETSHESLLKILYAADALYIASIALSRCSSTLSLSTRLPYGNRQKMLAHTIAATSLLWLIAATLIVMLRPPLAHPWTTYAGASSLFYRYLSTEVFASLLDLAIAITSVSSIVPFPYPSPRSISNHAPKRAIALLVVTSIGRMLCITAIVIRLIYLSPDLRIEPSTRLSILSTTTLALTHLSTILAFCAEVQAMIQKPDSAMMQKPDLAGSEPSSSSATPLWAQMHNGTALPAEPDDEHDPGWIRSDGKWVHVGGWPSEVADECDAGGIKSDGKGVDVSELGVVGNG